MNVLKAIKRTPTTSGEINKLRSDGFIPAILYGGKKDNINISLKKLQIQEIIKTETFMSKVVDLNIDGNSEKVVPRDVAYDPVSDEPIHIDFMRISKGSTLILEIPVRFINNDKSPGLKKGGVINVVRRKVELKCTAENIPDEIVIDLENTEIGTSIKISSIKLPEKVSPTITDRDFVIATLVAPTIVVEPEKTEETAVEGEAPAEGVVEGEAGTEGAGETKETKTEDGKEKTAKTSSDKTKASQSDNKGQPASKEKETKKK